MVKDPSRKSNRGHDRFKNLYAKDQPATTPELANRAPRQVAQSVTPTSHATTATTGNGHTPVTKTPTKPKPQQKKAKWSHVPSASDGEVTHFENFENDGKAQLAVAKIKTRELQWKSQETAEGGTPVDRTIDDEVRQEVDSTGGSTGSTASTGGSTEDLRLKPFEQTQEGEEDPDQKEVRQQPNLPLLSPPPHSPPKVQPSKEAVQSHTVQPVPNQQPQQVHQMVPPIVQPSREAVQLSQKNLTKRDQKKPKSRRSTRDTRKPAPPPAGPPANDNLTTRDKLEKGAKKEGAEPTTANYLTALKLMKILKRNNYLENALRFEDGEKVRKHFESVGFNQAPPPQILTLLNRAMEFVLDTVLFRADDLDTVITNDLRVFIIKKQEARDLMLEVIFHRPDLMPNKWGGARVEAKRAKSQDGGKKGWFSSFFR